MTELNGHSLDGSNDVYSKFVSQACSGANLLSADIQHHIRVGRIDSLPDVLVVWFRDYIKLSGQMHARDHNVNESHACRSLLATAEAELRRRDLLSAAAAEDDPPTITAH